MKKHPAVHRAAIVAVVLASFGASAALATEPMNDSAPTAAHKQSRCRKVVMSLPEFLIWDDASPEISRQRSHKGAGPGHPR